MTEQYVPQKGDRVRVTLEGTVEPGAKGFRVTCPNDDEINGSGHYNWFHPGFAGVTIEKLRDPEPTWVDGDVVRRCALATPIMRVESGWLCANGLPLGGNEISTAWRTGVLEILYKADAEKKVA